MAMQFGPGAGDGGDEPLDEMNMTPLIDVMLVLLIMFIITIPIQTHAVKMNMPVGPSVAQPQPPQIVRIDVDFDGTIGWNGEIVADRSELEARLAAIAALP
jgi:biopolymer transport protein ExbD